MHTQLSIELYTSLVPTPGMHGTDEANTVTYEIFHNFCMSFFFQASRLCSDIYNMICKKKKKKGTVEHCEPVEVIGIAKRACMQYYSRKTMDPSFLWM